MQNETVLGYAL